jgi:hypothetical protein
MEPDMTEAAAVDFHPAFRAMTARIREFRRVIGFHVGHLGFDVAMLESGRTGALQFVVLFSPRDADAQANDVRIVFAAVGDDQASIAVRGPAGGKNLGTYRLVHMKGPPLRDVVNAATSEAAKRVRALATTRTRRWQEWPADRRLPRTEQVDGQ